MGKRSSDKSYWELMRDGMRRGSVGAETVHGMKSPASSTNALDGGVVTDTSREEDTRHRPLPRSVSPGKLRLVWDMPKRGPTRPKASEMPPLGVGPRLRMIVGGKV